MRVKNCYLCGIQFFKEETWNPDNSGVVERLCCSLKCDRMYRIAYDSDATLRLEHAIKRAQDALRDGADGTRAIELRLRIASLKRSLKEIKKARGKRPGPVTSADSLDYSDK